VSTRQDLLECEERDDNGYPRPRGPITRPRATIDSGGAPLNGTNVDQSVGKRVNEALPWAVMAALFGGLAFGGLIIMAIMMPQQMRAETRAAQTEIRAEFAQEIARIDAKADSASAVSDVWRNRVNRLEAEANANRR